MEISYAIGENVPLPTDQAPMKNCVQNHVVSKPFEIIASICCFCWSLAISKKSVSYLNSVFTHCRSNIENFGRPRCTRPYPYEWTESNRLVYANHMLKINHDRGLKYPSDLGIPNKSGLQGPPSEYHSVWKVWAPSLFYRQAPYIAIPPFYIFLNPSLLERLFRQYPPNVYQIKTKVNS